MECTLPQLYVDEPCFYFCVMEVTLCVLWKGNMSIPSLK